MRLPSAGKLRIAQASEVWIVDWSLGLLRVGLIGLCFRDVFIACATGCCCAVGQLGNVLTGFQFVLILPGVRASVSIAWLRKAGHDNYPVPSLMFWVQRRMPQFMCSACEWSVRFARACFFQQLYTCALLDATERSAFPPLSCTTSISRAELHRAPSTCH